MVFIERILLVFAASNTFNGAAALAWVVFGDYT
jgi:hypothetical protein